MWGCVYLTERWASILVAWAHFATLGFASFMYHGTLLDVYWNFDRSMCYLFVLPFITLELLELTKTSLQKWFCVGLYASIAASFGASTDLTDAVQPWMAYVMSGLYITYTIFTHSKTKMRIAYIILGFCFLIATYIVLRVVEFCHGAWLGNVTIGHLLTVPGATLLVASYFLAPSQEKKLYDNLAEVRRMTSLVF